MARKILIVSASMGAGHDGAAKELSARLIAQGNSAEIVDYMEMIPFRLGGVVRWSYKFQLRHFAWTYDLTYQAFSRGGAFLWAPVVWAMGLLTRRPIRRVLLQTRPDAIVSTYPLASLVLGRMRSKHWLKVPVATFLTDFAVHSLWVHPGVDLHLAVSPESAARANQRGSHTSVATGPLVPERFNFSYVTRDDTRRRLGIEPHTRAVLVVAGSWGVGDLKSTTQAIAGCGPEYHPIVVCGQDKNLRANLLAESFSGTILGWTEEMPSLMAASDALVENAGGLSAMEAFAAGLPVISYQSIAGHGKDNARVMAQAGVTRRVNNKAELADALADTTTPGSKRDEMIAAGHALFVSDPAESVEELASATDSAALMAPFDSPRGMRRLGSAAAVLVILYAVLTIGFHGVAALGVGVAKAPKGVTNTVYLGVRVDQRELNNRALDDAIHKINASVIVDAKVARNSHKILHQLTDSNFDIVNGGMGVSRTLRWVRSRDDCDTASLALAKASGLSPKVFMPGRSIDAFDEFYCRTGKIKSKLVRANTKFLPPTVPTLIDRKIYLLDARKKSATAVKASLEKFYQQAQTKGLQIQPLGQLR